jgi:hypothetical protein
MHRPLLIAAFLLVLAAYPLSAQHGGGHASFGGHGGMAHGSSAGHGVAGHASGGMRLGSHFTARGSPHASSFHRSPGSRGFNHFRDRRFRDFRFRNNCFGYACRGFGYPWWYAGAFDPYWGDSGSSYDQDRQNEIALANQMNAQSLQEQRMREQDNQDVYARSAPAPALDPDPQPVPATLLVFRDQHKQEVQNYAIVGQTLWSFTPQRTQKIPLSDLDLPATTKANDERGVDFRVPSPHEGQ